MSEQEAWLKGIDVEDMTKNKYIEKFENSIDLLCEIRSMLKDFTNHELVCIMVLAEMELTERRMFDDIG